MNMISTFAAFSIPRNPRAQPCAETWPDGSSRSTIRHAGKLCANKARGAAWALRFALCAWLLTGSPSFAAESSVTSTSSVAAPVYEDGSDEQVVSQVSAKTAKARSQVAFNGALGDRFTTTGNGVARRGNLTINVDASGSTVTFSSSGYSSVAASWGDTFIIHGNEQHPDGSKGRFTVSAPVGEDTSYSNTGPSDQTNVVKASLAVNTGLGDGGKFALVENPAPGGFVLEPGMTEFVYGCPIVISAFLFARAILQSSPVVGVKSVTGSFRLSVANISVTDLDGVEQFGFRLTSESGTDYLRPERTSVAAKQKSGVAYGNQADPIRCCATPPPPH